jgi:hypothetical protein
VNISKLRIEETERRWREHASKRKENEALIQQGRPLLADDPARVEALLARRGIVCGVQEEELPKRRRGSLTPSVESSRR